MKLKYSLSNHTIKQIPIYLAGVLICSSILTLSISFKTKLKKEEIFDVFISSSSLKVDTAELKKAIESKFDTNIMSFNVHVFNPNQSDYAKFFNTVAVNSDLLILSEDSLNMVDSTQCLELPEKYRNVNNFVSNDKQIGYLVYNGSSGYLIDYIDYESKNYYALVNGISVHTLDFLSSGKTSTISNIFEGLLSNE